MEALVLGKRGLTVTACDKRAHARSFLSKCHRGTTRQSNLLATSSERRIQRRTIPTNESILMQSKFVAAPNLHATAAASSNLTSQ